MKVKKRIARIIKIVLLILAVLLVTEERCYAYVEHPISGKVSEKDFPKSKEFDERLYKQFEEGIKEFNISDPTIIPKLNPCMAFAMVWGESGSNNENTMTLVGAFSNKHYNQDDTKIDWKKLANNIDSVDSLWYLTFADNEINTCENGEAYGMPSTMLQGWSKTGSFDNNLGVGSYQISTKNWSGFCLDDRVNPLYGFEKSVQMKKGFNKPKCNMYSDVTYNACLSLAHGGMGFFQRGQKIIDIINRPEIQDEMWKQGMEVYKSMKETKKFPSLTKNIHAVADKTGTDILSWKLYEQYRVHSGHYVIKHGIEYCAYKIYFNEGKIPKAK